MAEVFSETTSVETSVGDVSVIECALVEENVIELTVDDRMNQLAATISTTTEVEAEVSGGATNANAINLGSGAGIYKEALLGILRLRSLLSSDSTISITEDGDEIDIILNGLGTLMQIYELKNSVKSEITTYYSELPDEAKPTRIDIWTDIGKGTKLFTTLLTWTAGKATKIVNTDEVTGKVLTTDLTYHDSGKVATISEVLT